ncbi:MAG: hypothetical protein KDA61_15095 [Planctomycetales bacterium]|nr:hypothetical protein [Planctomycetales bacterium]
MEVMIRLWLVRWHAHASQRRKFYDNLTIIAALAIFFTSHAGFTQAAQRLVLMEKYSASWCPHCSEASRDIASLLSTDGEKFVTFDAFASTQGLYATPWGVERAFSFYGISGYPTVYFDGVESYAGSHEARDSYQSLIDARAAVPTHLAMDIAALPLGDNRYEVTTSLYLEPEGEPTELSIYVIEAIDQFGVYSDGVTRPHNTFWAALESARSVVISPGEIATVTQTIELDATSVANFDDVRLIAWAQNGSQGMPGEIDNAAQALLSTAHPADFNSDTFVDPVDLALWSARIGERGAPGAPGDGTHDGRVDGTDFLIWQRYQGARAAAASDSMMSAPEPTTCTIALLVGSVAVCSQRFARRQ